MTQILTLTTDFGLSDGYVAAMKGVVLTCLPDAQIVDITHQVPAQDIVAGAFAMRCACGFFSAGAVHVGVIDPGVGSDRRGIVVETEHFVYVGPDNGLFSWVYAQESVRRIVAIENAALMRPQVSSTFHGRDVFALVARICSRACPVARWGRKLTIRSHAICGALKKRETHSLGRWSVWIILAMPSR